MSVSVFSRLLKEFPINCNSAYDTTPAQIVYDDLVVIDNISIDSKYFGHYMVPIDATNGLKYVKLHEILTLQLLYRVMSWHVCRKFELINNPTESF